MNNNQYAYYHLFLLEAKRIETESVCFGLISVGLFKRNKRTDFFCLFLLYFPIKLFLSVS
jgi:hypothetical protein